MKNDLNLVLSLYKTTGLHFNRDTAAALKRLTSNLNLAENSDSRYIKRGGLGGFLLLDRWWF